MFRACFLTAFAFWCVALLPAEAQEKAHAPDGVTLCLTLEPTVLDPTQNAGQVIREVVVDNIFEGLTAIDRNGKIVPRLAASWEISSDGLHYVFHLQPTAVFHDGTPFTADDVVFTFNRAKTAKTTVETWIFKSIKDMRARDAHTLEITLSQRDGLFLYGLGWGDAVIFSEKTAQTNAVQPVGTGPYQFKSWRRGDSLSLIASPNWWNGKPAIQNVLFRFIPDNQAMRAALDTGECDMTSAGGAPEQVAALKKNPKLQVLVGTTEGETILAMNNGRKPFDDIRVRRALGFAIDRKAVIDGAMSGYGIPIGSHFSPNHPAYIDLTGASPYDPQKARQLLKEAGFANGIDVTLSAPPMDYARRSAQIIAALLAKVDIRVTLLPLEFPQWLERVYKNKDYDLSIVSHTEPLDIRIYARDDYYFQYKSPEFKQIIEQAFAADSESAQNLLLQQAQKKLSDDAVNVFLFELPKIAVAQKNLKGMWQNWPMALTPVSELSWAQ